MKVNSNAVYLLLGSNLGDRKQLLAEARILIEEKVGTLVRISPVFETAAWGRTDLPAHLNQAVLVNTRLAPLDVLDRIQEIETQLGRHRQEQWGTRTMDIDIIFYDQEVIELERLKVPHPLLQERRFALTPLNTIAGRYLHPVLKKTVTELTEQCKDPLPVERAEELVGVNSDSQAKE